MSERMVERFTRAERVYHWVYFAAFAVLAVTGGVLLVPWTAFSAGEAGETNRLLHRIFGAVLIVAPLVALAWREFGRDTREGFRWTHEDTRSFLIMARRTYWNGDTTGVPPQGKFMPGQKLNIMAQTLLFAVLALSGVVLWFGKGALPQWLTQVAIVVHAVSAIGAVCMVIVHLYMVTTLPFSSGAVGAMFTGKISEDLAKSHHPGWRP